MAYLNNYTGLRTTRAPVQATATNAQAQATLAASAQMSHVIQGVWISASAAPAAAVTATLAYTAVEGSTAVTVNIQIPASVTGWMPGNVIFPIICAKNTSVTLTLPALGTGVTGTVSLWYDSVVAA